MRVTSRKKKENSSELRALANKRATAFKSSMPLNAATFDYIATLLFKDEKIIEAVKLCVMDGMTAYAAEVQIYGKSNTSVAKRVARFYAYYDECYKVASLASRPVQYLNRYKEI